MPTLSILEVGRKEVRRKGWKAETHVSPSHPAAAGIGYPATVIVVLIGKWSSCSPDCFKVTDRQPMIPN